MSSSSTKPQPSRRHMMHLLGAALAAVVVAPVVVHFAPTAEPVPSRQTPRQTWDGSSSQKRPRWIGHF